ncbi:MAG: hypothetical protein EOO61_16530 [Hymenobacter sp.]|nr:MAG: hypothetical protein EOO61_16530 [Hymenobacter sp.]
MKLSTLLYTIILCTVSAFSFAQGNLHGTVTDARTHEPLAGVMISNAATLRSPNTSPVKQRVGSLSETRMGSPATSPAKQSTGARRSSIWDSFFQYDISYQGGKKK